MSSSPDDAEREARAVLGYTAESWLSVQAEANVCDVARALRRRDEEIGDMREMLDTARADERSKIAERLRERAAECEAHGSILRDDLAAEWHRAARVLLDLASSLTSPEETGQ